METAWIQVFVLMMSECIAPSGKTVCQQQEYTIEFASKAACELAREQMVTLKELTSNIIVDRERTRCIASAKETQVYASVEDASSALQAQGDWAPPETAAKVDNPAEKAHKERLASLPTCEDARGRAPCKIGEIIIEGDTQQSAEVWRRQN